MAENDGFEDHMGPTGTSFSQLLFSDDRLVGLDFDRSTPLTFSSAAIAKPPTMLCFGKYEDSEAEHVLFPAVAEPNKRTGRLAAAATQKSGVTCSDTSSTSSINNNNTHRKRNGSAAAAPATFAAAQRSCKRNRSENPTPTRARKEKLGERIAALQQLVSPFGKTDTASVLHEAMGYIRFLQDQVQVLCSPYLQHHNQPDGGGSGGCGSMRDLRSRGLCLVPVELTVHVDNSNGADFWSPAMGNGVSSSTTKTVNKVD